MMKRRTQTKVKPVRSRRLTINMSVGTEASKELALYSRSRCVLFERIASRAFLFLLDQTVFLHCLASLNK